MATTVYRSRLRTGWIVQCDASPPFRIDYANLATVHGHCRDRLGTIAPALIALSPEWVAREGEIPLVIDDIRRSSPVDEVLLGLSNDSWTTVPLSLIQALIDLSLSD